MCGVTGLIRSGGILANDRMAMDAALRALQQRGPDHQASWEDQDVLLGHARLSIFDTSAQGHQPMHSANGQFHIAYNGECYNFKDLRSELEKSGVVFKSDSDTEVLLEGFANWGTDLFQKINGFFGLAVYDQSSQTLTIARDRMGIKPMLYTEFNDCVAFSSELKGIWPFDFEKHVNTDALYTYLQLNYIPADLSIAKGVNKLSPGTYRTWTKTDDRWVGTTETFYSLDQPVTPSKDSYWDAQANVRELLQASVDLRLAADVPVGTFLSGGIDSSIISTLASASKTDLRTFSIGYADEPFYDETSYAELVAKKIGSRHTTFKLTNQDLFDQLFDVLDYLDEPFADSSAIAVNILSERTRKEVTVALSGDGADEMFSGYNKHMAEYRVRQGGLKGGLVKALAPVWSALPHSRATKFGNLFRQLDRFAVGAKLNGDERYWRWASLMPAAKAKNLLNSSQQTQINKTVVDQVKTWVGQGLNGDDFNAVLIADLKMVLGGDMLRKVDSMSMAHSLEVRTPFLDHNLVDYVRSLPANYKINGDMKKRLLQDAYRDVLPPELYQRPKHGFEVPIVKWLQHDLWELINEKYLSQTLIQRQNIFDWREVNALLKQLKQPAPGDAPANIWALVVFQHWWLNYMDA